MRFREEARDTVDDRRRRSCAPGGRTRGAGVRRALAIACASAFGACAEGSPSLPPLESWTREVPAEVRVVQHAWLPPEERSGVVRVTRDLHIDERGDDLDYIFGHRGPHVAVDADGRMYVADPGYTRVLVYDANGDHLRTIGREGEGPGEFAFPLVSVVVGDRLIVSDTQRGRLSAWTLDGELEWDRNAEVFPGYMVAPTVGLDDGSWLTRFRIPRTDTEVVRRMSSTGAVIGEFAPIEVPGRIGYPPDAPRLMIYAGSSPTHYAPAPDGNVYVSPLDAYQIYSYSPDGEMRWALQVAAPDAELAEPEKAWATEWFRSQGYPDIVAAAVDWPERTFALADIKVDGGGRVYAFPYVPRGVEHDRLPVDVYDADGDRILAGWLEGDIEGLYWLGSWKPGPMLGVSWQTALGDHVYGVTEHPVTGQFSVIRFRLEIAPE